MVNRFGTEVSSTVEIECTNFESVRSANNQVRYVELDDIRLVPAIKYLLEITVRSSVHPQLIANNAELSFAHVSPLKIDR